ncbi:MAG: HAMP domain-containing histidine kinase [Sphingobacteriaceae bacterium]|nr:MAG: HAMP domain-containing histidine kinase [Sphingobacteriaceae bacterium]
MRVHFFSSIDLPYRSSFESFYTLQNLQTVKAISAVYFVANLFLRLVGYAGNLSTSTITNISEYDAANWFSLAVIPVFYFISVVLIKRFDGTKNALTIAQMFVILFALYIILSGMRSTFFVMHNPRNTMVLYFMGLMVTGVFFTFEYLQTLFIALLTGACFALVLPFYQTAFNEIVMNNLASIVLLIAFFSISRFGFSYRADNFLKLKAIEEKNQEIENASLIKNEILGIVAHDLRNPLAAIKTIAMVMEDDETINADNQDNLQMIKSACDKAVSIINDLLETAQNEISELDIEPTELNQFLQKIVNDWKRNTNARVNLLYYGTAEPVYSGINAEKMQRVMDNLISNAIKFSGDSNVEVSLQSLNSQVIINVKDFGMGIPNDLLPFIFDRFSKASRKGVRGEESVGLGLSIVQQIVKKHGGEIEVDSIEQHGTTFKITLPTAA